MIKFETRDRLLESLVRRLGEDGYRVYLERLRWPGGAVCPRCSARRPLWMESRRKHSCRRCGYQFRVTVGTLFHDSNVPLSKWLLAVSLVVESEHGFPATRLQRAIGGSYKTAWFVEHRIRAAMEGLCEDAGPIAGVEEGAEPWDEAAPEGLPSRPVRISLIAGPYRNASAKYLPAYWNEARWRAENGRGPEVFRKTLVALLNHPPLPYAELTRAVHTPEPHGGTR